MFGSCANVAVTVSTDFFALLPKCPMSQCVFCMPTFRTKLKLLFFSVGIKSKRKIHKLREREHDIESRHYSNCSVNVQLVSVQRDHKFQQNLRSMRKNDI